MPRLRGVSHQIAFVIALPVGVALAVSAQGDVARGGGDRVRGERRRHVRRQHPVPPDRLGAAGQALARAGRPHDDLRADRGTYTPITLLVLHPGWRTPILVIVLGRCAGRDRREVPLARRTPVVRALELRGARRGRSDRSAADLQPDRNRGRALARQRRRLLQRGAVVYSTRRPDPRPATFGYHEIFHSLVIAAVACQYATVAFYVLPQA